MLDALAATHMDADMKQSPACIMRAIIDWHVAKAVMGIPITEPVQSENSFSDCRTLGWRGMPPVEETP